MREPNIRKIAGFSALLHLSFLVLAIVLVKYPRNIVIPSPYTISLVSPDKTRQPGPPVSAAREVESAVTEKRKTTEDSKKMIDTGKKVDQQRLEDRISELVSKKKVERIVKLRSVISVQAGDMKSAAKPSEKEGMPRGEKGTLFDNYYGKITEEIRQEWIYPDMGKKELETVVLVVIRRDGTITVQGIEKSSGDMLFDRSVLKAVTKASPVTPPPYEMEIGMRFFP